MDRRVVGCGRLEVASIAVPTTFIPILNYASDVRISHWGERKQSSIQREC